MLGWLQGDRQNKLNKEGKIMVEEKELTEEELDGLYGEYLFQLEGDRLNAIYEAELDLKELELERKIKELEELRRSRRLVY